MEQDIKRLEIQIADVNWSIGQLQGRYDTLFTQVESSKQKITQLEEVKKIDLKAIEVLNLVQKSTRDVIKNTFEGLVTYALRAIYQEPYTFALKFDNRGNLGTLDFLLKSPENKEPLPLEDCTAGGSLDVISLALRFVLLRVMTPTFEGPVILDEPCKQLSKNFAGNELNFYNFIANKLQRQIILITHNEKIVELAENKIEVTK